MKNIKQSIIPELVSGSSTQVVVVNDSYFLSRQKVNKKLAANAHKKHFQPGSLTTRCAQTNQTPNLVERLFDSPLRRPSNGFTLIELLVVVLIIAILAAVALPQYQKAVEKSKAMQALSLLKSLAQAQHSYYLAQGKYDVTWKNLEIDLPGRGNIRWVNGVPAISDGTWSIQLYPVGSVNWSIYMGRISGPYAGAGFIYTLETDRLVCKERSSNGMVFLGEEGSYCEHIMNGNKASPSNTGPTYSIHF